MPNNPENESILSENDIQLLVMAASNAGATVDQIRGFLDQANEALTRAALIDLVLKGYAEIIGFDGTDARFRITETGRKARKQ